MAAEDVCRDYASSLEDLTFNSKPLINMLTMLAEENSQHATDIVKLIEKRIYEVTIEQKLPSLYLMDSIVKNIGKYYTAAVSSCIVALFTHVFEQADEKKRMSMFKLRNTWPAYFPPKILHELDCSAHKRDPGWPVVNPPPPSPSIHINPKFLSKVEEAVEESTISSSSSDEAKIMDEFERKKKELELLQGEQMREQMMQLEELKMKYELIKKKQEKDRQNLLKQQQEQILKMRLQQEEADSGEEFSSGIKLSEVSSAAKPSIRDPRIKKLEQETDNNTETDNSTDNSGPEQDEEKLASIAEKPVDKVGFDMEFVPLDKENESMDTTPVVAYNRDRPLGKNRYFRKDPKAKIAKTDSDSGSDFGDTKTSRTINRRGRRGIAHHNDRHELAKENDRSERGGERGRGRARKRHSGDRAGVRSHDRPGEPPIGFQPNHGPPDRSGKNERPLGRRGERPPEDRPGGWDPSGRHPPEDHFGERPGRPVQRPGADVGKDTKRRRRGENEDDKNMYGRRNRREQWSRGQRKPYHRGHARPELEGRPRPDFPQPFDNTGRLQERREQGFDRPDGIPPFERGEEPLFKRSRPSPPRPLFSDKEIFEIRERRRDDPDHPLEEWRQEFREDWRHDVRHPSPNNFQARSGPGPQGFTPRGDRPPFGPRGMPGEFPHSSQHFPGDVAIPLELTLDNEAEIIRSADHRLRMGELSVEQHRELLEKLHQLYELQKWQRRRSLDMPPESGHPAFLPALHPPAASLSPHGKELMAEPNLNSDGNQVLSGPDMLEHQRHLGDRPHAPANEMLTGNLESPSTVLPDQTGPTAEDAHAPPSNLLMEKQTVDDLFSRLVDFGIITKVDQGGAAPVARTMTPPVVETQLLQEIPEILKLPELPEIKLTLDHLRSRYDGVIMGLHRGTQCSSCGVRFKEADNENYRQHLDWHFRMNRKEKETMVAHRNWFITTEDWLEFESSEDPNVKARSAVFEAESDGESAKSEDLQDGSCPVLMDDTETEKACDICLEKFETFWEETSEDWHYKNAVRVDGKTYHYLCYQDAKEDDDSDVGASDDENVDENIEDTDDDNDYNIDDNNATTAIKEEKGDSIESCITDDKSSVVTTAALESEVESVDQGADQEVDVNNTNKEEIKTESS